MASGKEVLQWNYQQATGTNVHVLLDALKACSRTRDLERGKQVHAQSIECGQSDDVYVANALINMYAKCGCMVDARKLFDGMRQLTVVSWNALILGYANNGQGHTALDMFTKTRTDRAAPDSLTLVAALKACTSLAVEIHSPLERGKEIHNVAVEIGYNSDVYVQSTLIDIYAKCGSMMDAREVFEVMKQPTVVSWTVLIMGYAENGEGHIALDIFSRMADEGFTANPVTFVAALKACASLEEKEGISRWDRGQEIHNIAVENDCSSDAYVQSTLVDVYSKCGNMVGAREVFEFMKLPDVVSWTVLILGYAENGKGLIALDIFTRMRFTGHAPNSVTFLAAFKACASIAVEGVNQWAECKDRGKEIHSIAVENGYSTDIYVQNSLIDMYGMCGSMADASVVFDAMHQPTVVSWTSLIMGYAGNEQGRTALEMFARMRTEGPLPSSITLVAALKACTSLAVIEGAGQRAECRDKAKGIYILTVENECKSDAYVQSALVELHAKCGNMREAREVFDGMKHSDVVSWTVLMLGYADNGQGHTALDLFIRMKNEGPAPDAITFRFALKACSLVGALDFGRTIHSELKNGIDLDVVLVTCLVDFYAKCGSLVEAQSVFDLHIDARDLVTWNALLAGFSSCGDKKAVFGLFEGMQDAGFMPDDITFLCVLTCCSHAGLVVKGKKCFDSMSAKYDVVPTLKHYTCMIDLYGRANKIDTAMALLKDMPCIPDDVTWMTILDACRKWKNVEIGIIAFESLNNLNYRDAASYVLMAQIYGSRGMLQEQAMVMGLKKKLKAYRRLGETCWTNEAGHVHTFLVEDSRHPQSHEIREKWESMVVVMKKHGYTPNLLSITGDEKVTLCSHSERLALVCALINTEKGKTIRIVKNLKVCDECHISISIISKVECRTIICRDASRMHVFQDGNCACGGS